MTAADSYTRVRQAALIDEIVWSRLSKFWTTRFDASDRFAIEALYEAMFTALDAEYIRLLQISQSSSLRDCPALTQRRWLLLDLQYYAAVRAWLNYILRTLPRQVDSNADVIRCYEEADRAAHWHVMFTWVVPAVDAPIPLQLGLGLITTTFEAWRNGLKLAPGLHYSIDAGTVAFTTGAIEPGDQIVVVAGFVPVDNHVVYVERADPVIGTNTIVTTRQFAVGFPVHVQVVRDPPETPDRSNNGSYTTARDFYAYSGDIFTGGAAHGAPNQVLVPPTVSFAPTDRAYVVGYAVGEQAWRHDHVRDIIRIRGEAAPIQYVSLTRLPARGIIGEINGFGQIFRVVVDGNTVSPSEYRYDGVSNRVYFRTPYVVSITDVLHVQVHYTSEGQLADSPLSGLHIHQECTASVTTSNTYDRFDDGGNFDDGGTFDTAALSSAVRLPRELDAASAEVYLDGVELYPGQGVTVVSEGGVTLLYFSIPAAGRLVDVVARRQALLYSYTKTDLLGGLTTLGLPESLINTLLGSLPATLAAFRAETGYTDVPDSVLVDALRIAAAGGNPLFALFRDEFLDFPSTGVTAADAYVDAVTARNLESADTTLEAIPRLNDHVLTPGVVYLQDTHYLVSANGIESSVDLSTAPWWCPIVVLDEKLLAKNFGALLGNVQASSTAYRNSLAAQTRLAYQGPSMTEVHRAACILLGSPTFAHDGTIRRIRDVQLGYTIRMLDIDTGQEQLAALPSDATPPAVGSLVDPGQSLAGRAIFADRLGARLVSWTGDTLVLNADIEAVVGARVYLELWIYGAPVWSAFTIRQIHVTQSLGGILYAMRFDITAVASAVVSGDSRMRVYTDGGAPYAALSGSVVSVTPITQAEVVTDRESVRLPIGVRCLLATGQEVRAGDPLQPDLAQVYDHVSRPNWHWLTYAPEVEPPPTITLELRAGSGGLCTADVVPGVLPGCRLVVSATRSYLVVGVQNSTMWLSPDVLATHSVTATVVRRPPSAADQLFEEPIDPAVYTIVDGQQYGGASLLLTTSTGLPARGRFRIGYIEASFMARNGNRLSNLEWRNDFESIRDPVTGVLDMSIPSGTTARVVSRYVERRINPAFIAAVNQRTVNDTGNIFGTPVLATEEDIDAYYALYKDIAGVVETSAVVPGAGLARVITDSAPANTTLVILSRQNISETYDPAELEGGGMTDTVISRHPMIITVSPTPVGDVITVPGSTVDLAVRLSITDVDHPVGPWQVTWTVSSLSYGVSIDTTDIFIAGLVPGASYTISYTCENPAGQRQSRTLSLVVQL